MTLSGVPSDDDLLHVGQIHAAYGLKGWVWVYSYTDPMTNLFAYTPWYVRQGSQWKVLEVAEWREQGKGLVMRLEGSDDRNGADALQGMDIWAPRASLPSLDEGDYYWSDLTDMSVHTVDGRLLGRVHGMMETGANDVLVVRGCEGSLDSHERLIPWLPDLVVREVSLPLRRLTVDWDPDF